MLMNLVSTLKNIMYIYKKSEIYTVCPHFNGHHSNSGTRKATTLINMTFGANIFLFFKYFHRSLEND